MLIKIIIIKIILIKKEEKNKENTEGKMWQVEMPLDDWTLERKTGQTITQTFSVIKSCGRFQWSTRRDIGISSLPSGSSKKCCCWNTTSNKTTYWCSSKRHSSKVQLQDIREIYNTTEESTHTRCATGCSSRCCFQQLKNCSSLTDLKQRITRGVIL